jgi:CRISPR-associated protein (TIGR02710 family)
MSICLLIATLGKLFNFYFGKNEMPMNSHLLIATVGGTPEPLAASLLHWRPVRVFFVVSTESKGAVVQIVSAVQTGGWPDFDGGRYDLIEVADAQDLSAIVTELRGLDERVSAWLRDHPQSEVIADFTGGTKAMSAGLALSATNWPCPCQISYVGGKERTKDGVGIVVSGQEQFVHAQNPWDALGYRAVEQAVLLFDHGDYSAALQLLVNTRDRMTDTLQKREFQAFFAFCQFFESWDRFQHKDASSKLKKIQESKNDLFSLLGKHRAEIGLNWVVESSKKLETLAASPSDANTLLARVYDLLANASRRLREGRYDDAVARLYRAIEAYGQVRLLQQGFPDTGHVLLEKMPEPLRLEWQNRAENGELKLGLQDNYKLLAALGDEVATRFMNLKLNDPKVSLLVTRNSSILAHGYMPVGKNTAEKLFDATLQLVNLGQSDFTLFPTLSLPGSSAEKVH